jgi:glucose-fructose oxidoreductase
MNPTLSAPFSRREFVRRSTLATAALALPRALRAADTPPPARKLGIALAGLGGYATGQLLPALQKTQYCHLAGVVTRDPAGKGRRWAQGAGTGFPEKNIYTLETMHRMADNPDIDIVYVVTPNGLHAEYAILAAMAGKHVITEKPMANTVAECDAMIRACEAMKRTLSVGYRLHYDPYNLELMRLGQDPDFGPFTSMRGDDSWFMNTVQWRMQHKLSGGGPLMDVGIYVVHGAIMAAHAYPVAVSATERAKTRPDFFKTVEEGIEWTMEFPGGATAKCTSSYNENFNRFHAEGPKGWVDMPSAFGYGGLKMTTNKGPVVFPEVNQQALHMDGIAKAILDGAPSPVPGDIGRHDMVIIEGIYRSAQFGGKRMELDYTA